MLFWHSPNAQSNAGYAQSDELRVLAGVELFDNKAFEISNMEARLLNADRQ